jgi:hypothetical protein
MLDSEVVNALNNLPGFPTSQTFKLGDWLVEIATRPAVGSVADLPLHGNQEGDARIVVDQASWYVWVGGSWYGAGSGSGTPRSPHNPARRVSANTSTLATDFTILVDASSGLVTVTLTGTNGTFYNVKKIDSSMNPVRLRPATGTIDGELFVDLPVRWDCISVHCEGGEWFIV